MVILFGSSKNKCIPVNILLLGDKGHGKSSLLMTFIHQEFPAEEILPEKVSYPSKSMMKYGQQILLKCFDTEQFMNLSKSKPTVVLVVASSDEGLESANSLWIPEVMEKWKNVPVILVGSKSDTRVGEDASNFRECAQTFVQRHSSVVDFREVSSMTPGGGVDELFEKAITLGMTASSQVGPFFDGVFKVSEYVGVVKDNKHYRATIEQVSPKSCKVRYIDSPFRYGNLETIKRRSRIKEWQTDCWLPLLFEDLNILSDSIAKIIATYAGLSKEDFTFIEKEPRMTGTLQLNKFQEHIVAKALELQSSISS